jgi:hypothetical protein
VQKHRLALVKTEPPRHPAQPGITDPGGRRPPSELLKHLETIRLLQYNRDILAREAARLELEVFEAILKKA